MNLSRTPHEELKAKGYDAFIIMEFLNDLVGQAPPPPGCDKLRALIWLACEFMGVMGRSPPFMTAEQSDHIATCGNLFLQLHLTLCHEERSHWRCRPKWHLLWHLINQGVRRKSHRNPFAESTFLDEDWIKKIQKICRKCHKTSASRAVLARYLVALQHKLAQAKK